MLFEMASFIVTALFTPWWGTAIVAATLRLLFFTRVRWLTFFALSGWMTAALYRDFDNLYAPSRILTKLLSLNQMGFALDSPASRLVVYSLMGVTGVLLAFFSASFVAAVQRLAAANNLEVGTEGD